MFLRFFYRLEQKSDPKAELEDQVRRKREEIEECVVSCQDPEGVLRTVLRELVPTGVGRK